MKRIKKRRFGIRALVITIVATVVLAAGGYAFYVKYQAEHQPPAKPVAAKASVDGTKKTPEQKLSYDVPGNHPKNLVIDSLGIGANVLPMGILADGALDAPKTAWDVGWYNQSALPGSGEGALLIDGHVNDALNTPGVFFDINSLKLGDSMKIERGDGTMYTYQVVQTDQKPIEQVDMAKMMRSITPGKEGLNLITCGGAYDSSRETYKDRILVYAVRIS
jgi:LPXTG-site transpeptidase (sortase) family protein